MKIRIKTRKEKPFQGKEGDEISYFWYRGLRLSDGVTIQFGSRDGSHREGDELDLDIEKEERRDGTFGYKEVTLTETD